MEPACVFFSAFSTKESSLCWGVRSMGGGGEGGGAEWVAGAQRKDDGDESGWGEAEWEESLGCQGVTSLDTTSSSPGNYCESPPKYLLLSLSCLPQFVNKMMTQKHMQRMHCMFFFFLKCLQRMHWDQNKCTEESCTACCGFSQHTHQNAIVREKCICINIQSNQFKCWLIPRGLFFKEKKDKGKDRAELCFMFVRTTLTVLWYCRGENDEYWFQWGCQLFMCSNRPVQKLGLGGWVRGADGGLRGGTYLDGLTP